MDYFAGLDISMDETHVCVLDREGVVVHEGKSASTAQSIADELVGAPGCRRIVFETGRKRWLAPQADIPIRRRVV
jgi:transposase